MKQRPETQVRFPGKSGHFGARSQCQLRASRLTHEPGHSGKNNAANMQKMNKTTSVVEKLQPRSPMLSRR